MSTSFEFLDTGRLADGEFEQVLEHRFAGDADIPEDFIDEYHRRMKASGLMKKRRYALYTDNSGDRSQA